MVALFDPDDRTVAPDMPRPSLFLTVPVIIFYWEKLFVKKTINSNIAINAVLVKDLINV